ncbi:rhomboid domain-containing protein 2 [Sceloporus undulatus]|uniref:rhomboid domain-containing protein 2 n=1 Tax=Sceloporus undulatus TaxID=8520 RepID=UPI001C4ADC5D|nr:rhomboid domain-containing protein 2 [Sceloporus undulatus]
MERRFPAAVALTVLLSLFVSGPRLLRWKGGGEEAEEGGSAFSLGPEALQGLQVYRLVTYIFVYDDPVSWVCGAIIAWYFAGSFEKTVGTVKHSFLTLAFAVASALLYLLLRAAFASVLEVTDAKGFAPVAFAMLAASIARSPMRRTLVLGVNLRVALVPWFLLCVAWFALISSFLANLCGLVIGNLYGYGFCSRVDLPESAVSHLDQKFPFQLLKRIPGLKYVPGSLAERRASQSRKLNPMPGSYPTQSYHSPPPPVFFAVPGPHPSMHPQTSRVQHPLSPAQYPTTSAFVEPCAQHHFHAPPGSSSSSSPHLGGSDSWVPARTDGSSIHQAPGFITTAAGPESMDLCRVQVG